MKICIKILTKTHGLSVARNFIPQVNLFSNQVNLFQPRSLCQTRSPCFNLDQFGAGTKHRSQVTVMIMILIIIIIIIIMIIINSNFLLIYTCKVAPILDPSISKNASEVSEISQVYLRAG